MPLEVNPCLLDVGTTEPLADVLSEATCPTNNIIGHVHCLSLRERGIAGFSHVHEIFDGHEYNVGRDCDIVGHLFDLFLFFLEFLRIDIAVRGVEMVHDDIMNRIGDSIGLPVANGK